MNLQLSPDDLALTTKLRARSGLDLRRALLLVVVLVACGMDSVQAQTVTLLRSISTETMGVDLYGAGEMGASVDISAGIILAGAPTYNEFVSSDGGGTFGPAGAVFAIDAASGELISRFSYSNSIQFWQPLGRRVALDGLRAATTRITNCCASPASGPSASWNVFTSDSATLFQQTLQSYGSSVAVRDDLVVIGSINDNRFLQPGQTVGGAAIVYDAVTGEQIRVLGPTDPGPGRAFGTSAEITDDFILVGAGAASGPGDVYVFDRQNGEQLRRIRPTSPLPGAFGRTLDAEGDLFIASSLASPAGTGRAWVYNARTGQALRMLQHPQPAASDRFAQDGVAISWPYAAITCASCSLHDAFDGAVFVFNIETGDLIATLGSPQPQFAGWFGSSVAMEGDTIVVGEVPNYPGPPAEPEGWVHVFSLDPVFISGFE